VNYKGTIKNGVVVLPPEAKLPEGATVEVIPEEVGSKENSAQAPTMQASMECVLDRLYAIFTESREAGWDGYGARAASYESYLEAKRFIEALPARCPVPEIAMDPDGEVSLEWYFAPWQNIFGEYRR